MEAWQKTEDIIRLQNEYLREIRPYQERLAFILKYKEIKYVIFSNGIKSIDSDTPEETALKSAITAAETAYRSQLIQLTEV